MVLIVKDKHMGIEAWVYQYDLFLNKGQFMRFSFLCNQDHWALQSIAISFIMQTFSVVLVSLFNKLFFK